MEKRLTFTRHAMNVLAERGIEADWVARSLREPERTGTDARDRTLKLALAKVPEFGNRWLRVVYLESADEIRIITAFFDRGVERRT